MIADPVTGARANFIPVYLTEGQESPVTTLRITPEVGDATLKGEASDAATIMARISPSAFVDISATPLDLSGAFGSFEDVDFKIVAAPDLPGVNRVLISAGIPVQSAAGWLN